MVFYRKYRPQTIEELDSLEVREKLTQILAGRNPPHAYLFSGPKGLGKTSTARILAKALNCERLVNQRSASSSKKQLNAEPCNKCDQCVSITNGTNLDVLEIDGASNRGIDEIRDLREKVRLSTVSASKKVYIIDEVHMLTAEAFNALLKTLEEPPGHVVFILCTTELHKVPETVTSRCFSIVFQRASEEELIRSFRRIAKKEKLPVDKESLAIIASLSDGSFREGVKILEEMSGYKKITKELLEEKYRVSSIKYQVSQMLELLEKKDAKGGLELVSKLVGQGADMKYTMEELVNQLHSLLLFKVGVETEEKSNKRELGIKEITTLVDLVSRAISQLKYAVLPQLPLELAIVEWGLGSARGPVVPSSHPMSSVASSLRALDGTPSSRATPRPEDLLSKLINKVKSYNHSLAGVLRGCKVAKYDGKKLIIETGFKFHKDKLSEPKVHEILEKVSREITKKNINIEIILKNR